MKKNNKKRLKFDQHYWNTWIVNLLIFAVVVIIMLVFHILNLPLNPLIMLLIYAVVVGVVYYHYNKKKNDRRNR